MKYKLNGSLRLLPLLSSVFNANHQCLMLLFLLVILLLIDGGELHTFSLLQTKAHMEMVLFFSLWLLLLAKRFSVQLTEMREIFGSWQRDGNWNGNNSRCFSSRINKHLSTRTFRCTHWNGIILLMILLTAKAVKKALINLSLWTVVVRAVALIDEGEGNEKRGWISCCWTLKRVSRESATWRIVCCFRFSVK